MDSQLKQWFAIIATVVAIAAAMGSVLQSHMATAENTYARRDLTNLQYNQLRVEIEEMKQDLKILVRRTGGR